MGGDVITTLDGTPLDSATTLTYVLDRHYPGDVIDLTWIEPPVRSAPVRPRWRRDLSQKAVSPIRRSAPDGLAYAERVPNTTPYRVVQWTTGNVGKSSVQAIAANPRSNSSGATRGQMTRSAATSVNSAVSSRSASPPPTTSTRCSP